MDTSLSHTHVDHDEPTPQASPTTDAKTFTIRLPKPSTGGVELLVLSFLIVVGLIQTVQLFAIQQTAASVKVSPAATGAPAAAPSGGSSGSELPGMVGGC